MGTLHLGVYLGPSGAAAICKDGEVCVAVEERALTLNSFTPQKTKELTSQQKNNTSSSNDLSHNKELRWNTTRSHDAYADLNTLPQKAIRYCLNQLNISWTDLSTITALTPDGRADGLRGNLFIGNDPRLHAPPEVHQALAYHAYCHSGLEESLVFVADQVGNIRRETGSSPKRVSYTIYHARGASLHPLYEHLINLHLKHFSCVVNTYTILAERARRCFNASVSDDELLAWFGDLATYGSQQPNLRPWFSAKHSELALSISNYDMWLELNIIEQQSQKLEISRYTNSLHFSKRMWGDLAYKAQQELTKALCQLINLAVERSGCRSLTFTGAFALDPYINTTLLHLPQLDTLYIPPAPLTSSIAIGCALFADLKNFNNNTTPLHRVDFGHLYHTAHVMSALSAFRGILITESLESIEMEQRFAQHIVQGCVIARYEGALSFGNFPCAGRSLLMDPSTPNARERLNSYYAHRDILAPTFLICPEDHCDSLFVDLILSPLGHFLATPREYVKDRLSPSLRADGRARVLTISEDSDLQLLRLCESLNEHFNRPPVLLAVPLTFTNGRVVESPSEAAHWMISGRADAMITGQVWFTRRHTTVEKPWGGFQMIQTIFEHPQLILPPLFKKIEHLDQLIFNPSQVSGDWSKQDISTLSREFAPYRTESEIFENHPIHPLFTSQLSESVTCLLNPHGQSLLIDDRGGWPARLYNWPQMITLISLLFDRSTQRQSLQSQLKQPHHKVKEMINWATAELESYGLNADSSWQDTPLNEEIIELRSEPILAPFKDPQFSLRGLLKSLWSRLNELDYSEERLAPFQGRACPQPLDESPTSNLIRLFWLNQTVEREHVINALGAELAQSLTQIGVLKTGRGWTSQISIDCICQAYIVSDSLYKGTRAHHEDICSPLTELQRGMIRLSLELKGGRTLDLSDTLGAVAIVQARSGAPVTVMTSNERALRFAHFNLQLNGIEEYMLRCTDQLEGIDGSPFDQIFTSTVQPFRTTGAHLRRGGRLYFYHEDLSNVGQSFIPLSGRCLSLSMMNDSISFNDPRFYKGFSNVSGYWIFEHHSSDRHIQQPTFYRPLSHSPSSTLGSYVEHFFSLDLMDEHQTIPHPMLTLIEKSNSEKGVIYLASNERWPSLSAIQLSDEMYLHMKALRIQHPSATTNPISDTLTQLGLKVTQDHSSNLLTL